MIILSRLFNVSAGMAELVDAHDSKSCGVIHESSILSPGTVNIAGE